jgi:hypothetical protein
MAPSPIFSPDKVDSGVMGTNIQPKMDCVYMGIINVDPYNPKPKSHRVPILKFPSFRTLKTMGYL